MAFGGPLFKLDSTSRPDTSMKLKMENPRLPVHRQAKHLSVGRIPCAHVASAEHVWIARETQGCRGQVLPKAPKSELRPPLSGPPGQYASLKAEKSSGGSHLSFPTASPTIVVRLVPCYWAKKRMLERDLGQYEVTWFWPSGGP